MVQSAKNLPAVQETWARSPGHEDPMEKGMATHSSILAWRRTPWSQITMGHKESDTTKWHARTHTHTHAQRERGKITLSNNPYYLIP